jgi:hypothetical protein
VPSLSSSPYASHPQPLPSPRASPAFASTPMLMPAQTVLASNPPIPSSLRREEQQNRAGLNSVYKAFVKQWCFEEGSLASEASVGLI